MSIQILPVYHLQRFFNLFHQCSVRKPNGISASRDPNSILIKIQSSDTMEIIPAWSLHESWFWPLRMEIISEIRGGPACRIKAGSSLKLFFFFWCSYIFICKHAENTSAVFHIQPYYWWEQDQAVHSNFLERNCGLIELNGKTSVDFKQHRISSWYLGGKGYFFFSS